MSLTATPYGFRAVNNIGGLPYAGVTRQVPIASGYAANIYNGSLVYITADGVVQICLGTGADGTTNALPSGTTLTGALGVFVGCEYTNPGTKQKIRSQYWPTGTVAADAVAYVIDDDRTVFQCQASGLVAATALGSNTFLSAAQSAGTSTGNTLTGNSTSAVTHSIIQTTAAFRIVGFVDMVGFSAVGDAYTDLYVKFNPGYHSYSNAVGL